MAYFVKLCLFANAGDGARIAGRRTRAWAFALTVLYAASDEPHQGFVAGRHLSVLDVGFDAAGALIALVVVGLVRSGRS